MKTALEHFPYIEFTMPDLKKVELIQRDLTKGRSNSESFETISFREHAKLDTARMKSRVPFLSRLKSEQRGRAQRYNAIMESDRSVRSAK